MGGELQAHAALIRNTVRRAPAPLVELPTLAIHNYSGLNKENSGAVSNGTSRDSGRIRRTCKYLYFNGSN